MVLAQQTKELYSYLAPHERKEIAQLLSAPAVQYAAFRERYYNDPAGFARDCIKWRDGEGLAGYQAEALASLVEHGRLAIRGPHGLGKTALAAVAVLWFALTRDGQCTWKVPTTASVWRQLTKFLWPEVRHWSRRLRWGAIGRDRFDERSELLKLSLELSTGQAFAVASNEPSAIEGAHAESILYIFDESKAIEPATFDAAEGALSTAGADTGGEAFALAISTPGPVSGRFYEIFARRGYEDWHTRHVTLDEAIAAGRISREWADKRKAQWGEGAAVYQNRVLGEFASSDESSVIPLAWVEAANERWHQCGGAGAGALSYGCDPARFGEDKTTIARLVGDVIERLEYHAREDTMQTAGRLAARIEQKTPVGIDVIGIGAGVVDRLREQGYERVLGVNVAEGTDMTDVSGELGFVNLRSALWWMMREMLDPSQGATLALPTDDLLTGDLTAPQWTYTSTGKIKVESKDDIRKRINRSTDAADGVALALYAVKGNGSWYEFW
jgi:hypothetical protein